MTSTGNSAENAALLDEIGALTKALTGLTCGGSEFFIRKGDRYLADIPACIAWVRRGREDSHKNLVRALSERNAARSALSEAEGELDRMREALVECVDVLAMNEHPAFPDPLYHAEVKALGERIGFGALMSTASAGWREVLAAKEWPTGGEFVAGPCFGTVQATLALARAALSPTRRTGDA